MQQYSEKYSDRNSNCEILNALRRSSVHEQTKHLIYRGYSNFKKIKGIQIKDGVVTEIDIWDSWARRI